MPELGEVRKSSDIGKRGTGRYIWQACEKCGKERWVEIRKGNPVNLRCYHCIEVRRRNIGSLNPSWKGGRALSEQGYMQIWLSSDDFFYPMANQHHYIREHRLIMARHLNRCLLPWEVVHHKNGIKTDNRLENLELLNANGRHNTMLNREIKKLQREVNQLQQRMIILEAENAIFKFQGDEQKWMLGIW